MINKLPGWANMAILWHVYFVIGFIVYGVFVLAGMLPWLWAFVAFEWIISGIHSGLYLAKWRFDGDGWRFW